MSADKLERGNQLKHFYFFYLDLNSWKSLEIKRQKLSSPTLKTNKKFLLDVLTFFFNLIFLISLMSKDLNNFIL